VNPCYDFHFDNGVVCTWKNVSVLSISLLCKHNLKNCDDEHVDQVQMMAERVQVMSRRNAGNCSPE